MSERAILTMADLPGLLSRTSPGKSQTKLAVTSEQFLRIANHTLSAIIWCAEVNDKAKKADMKKVSDAWDKFVKSLSCISDHYSEDILPRDIRIFVDSRIYSYDISLRRKSPNRQADFFMQEATIRLASLYKVATDDNPAYSEEGPTLDFFCNTLITMKSWILHNIQNIILTKYLEDLKKLTINERILRYQLSKFLPADSSNVERKPDAEATNVEGNFDAKASLKFQTYCDELTSLLHP